MNTSERILQLEKELTDLRAQERAEKEEARKRAAADKDKELTAIKNAIAAFNEKHEDNIRLVRTDLHIYNDDFFGKIIDRQDIEV